MKAWHSPKTACVNSFMGLDIDADQSVSHLLEHGSWIKYKSHTLEIVGLLLLLLLLLLHAR